jgi:hypothetical protein
MRVGIEVAIANGAVWFLRWTSRRAAAPLK